MYVILLYIFVIGLNNLINKCASTEDPEKFVIRYIVKLYITSLTWCKVIDFIINYIIFTNTLRHNIIGNRYIRKSVVYLLLIGIELILKVSRCDISK